MNHNSSNQSDGLTPNCQQCNAPQPAGAKFCGQCGARLAAEGYLNGMPTAPRSSCCGSGSLFRRLLIAGLIGYGAFVGLRKMGLISCGGWPCGKSSATDRHIEGGRSSSCGFSFSGEKSQDRQMR